MKTRTTVVNTTTQKGGGCCGSTPIKEATTVSAEVNNGLKTQVEEAPVSGSGCCS